jgi:hypothetical protein
VRRIFLLCVPSIQHPKYEGSTSSPALKSFRGLLAAATLACETCGIERDTVNVATARLFGIVRPCYFRIRGDRIEAAESPSFLGSRG